MAIEDDSLPSQDATRENTGLHGCPGTGYCRWATAHKILPGRRCDRRHPYPRKVGTEVAALEPLPVFEAEQDGSIGRGGRSLCAGVICEDRSGVVIGAKCRGPIEPLTTDITEVRTTDISPHGRPQRIENSGHRLKLRRGRRARGLVGYEEQIHDLISGLRVGRIMRLNHLETVHILNDLSHA